MSATTATSPDLLERLRTLPDYLNSRIKGQSQAVADFAGVFRRGEIRQGDATRRRPKGFVLFVGPTGVGKTEICLCASEHLFGVEAIARVNMAEFATENAVERLLGRDRDDDGALGEELRKLDAKRGKIVLLDEIEKAHARVSKLILGMAEGSVRFETGEVRDLSPYYFICTSNLGTAVVAEAATENMPRRYIRDVLMAACEAHFAKEVLGRFTAIVVFASLARAVLMKIATRVVAEELRDYASHPLLAGTHLLLSESAYATVVSEGYNPRLGARPMRNASESLLGDAVAAYLLSGSEIGPQVRLEFVPETVTSAEGKIRRLVLRRLYPSACLTEAESVVPVPV